MEISNVHVVAASGNRKTGPIPVTYRSMESCPADCPFLPTGATGGCYGTGRIFTLATKHAGTVNVDEASAKVRRGKDQRAKYLRDRVVGDVLTDAGKLDRAYVRGIARIATDNDLIAFGYSHAWRQFTRADVTFLRRSGYVMNASTETHEGAARAVALGLPTVLVEDDAPEGTQVAGRRLVTCPAETRDYVSCASCGLCANPNRRVIIRFHTHGVASAKARRAVEAAREREIS